MSSLLREPSLQVVEQELIAESPQLPDLRDQGVGGAHYWLLDRAIPFGGHWLIECACGCFGPFVLCVEDAERVRCAVALALSEGAARRAICGDATVDLRERDRAAVAHRG